MLVNGAAVPKTVYKSGTILMAQGGLSLKGMLPKNTPAEIVILNTNAGVPSKPFSFVP